jgi:antitoxin (DNA-binding transcriptional repressor) of toxin-antitoxin stability system
MIANVHEAKSQLSKLLDAVERGEEVVITRRGNGVNRFLIVAEPQRDWSHLFGALKDSFPDDIDYEAADRAMDEIWNEWFESLE